LACPNSLCSLHAPVGRDFDRSMLQSLQDRGVDIDPVCSIDAPLTPGESIRYEGERMIWEPVGWDCWPQLCAWVPPFDGSLEYDLVHVLVEGGGDGEVQAAMNIIKREPAPLLSIEPVMHNIDRESVSRLSRVSALADVVSPDFHTAVQMAGVCSSISGDLDDDRFRCEHLDSIAQGCAKALRMKQAAVLAIRDGAHGSYVFFEGRVCKIPAVPVDVCDPTGAGNAYASAIAAQLACGATPVSAARMASAVGAAFCRERDCSDWAPQDIMATSSWILSHALTLGT